MRKFLLALVLLCLSLDAFAWRGFVWAEWLEITQATKPEVTSPQSGHAALLPLLQERFDTEVTIESREAWEAKRERIKQNLQVFIGEPEPIEIPDPAAEELGREDMGSYERIHLMIPGEANDPIPAYFLRPKNMADASPIMIVLHQTHARGKEEPVGMDGSPDRELAKELVERGIACIAPDAIGFGERIPEGGEPYDGAIDLFRRHPRWSFFGKMNWDIARVIDYLETLPEVDAKRIGVIGHSHGAYGSIMAAVFEPRISLSVASCGFNMLRSDPRPERWSHLTALLPRLGFYVEDISEAPFDWHEIIACLAPKAFFNWSTLQDDIFPHTDNLAMVYRQVHEVYGLYGAQEKFAGRLGEGPHNFPLDQREAAYVWIEQQFDLRAGD